MRKPLERVGCQFSAHSQSSVGFPADSGLVVYLEAIAGITQPEEALDAGASGRGLGVD
jgi:hypothetical protein